MPFANRPPARTLARHPDLAQLKRQAKELLTAFEAGHPEAIAEIARHYRGATAEKFALHHAQLVLARSYGFDSWPKLKAYVDGVTVGRLIDAVRAGDVDTVRAMLSLRPELAHMDASENDEHRALHHAVLQRRPVIVTLLMDHGADAHKGIWPHRDATSPLTMAIERDDTEIVDIIREAESRRQGRGEERTVAPCPDDRRPVGHRPALALRQNLAARCRGQLASNRTNGRRRSSGICTDPPGERSPPRRT
jgi:hypothetical protein